MSGPYTSPSSQGDKTRICPNCFANVPYGTPICPNCNSIMPISSLPPSFPPPGPLPKKSNTGLILGIVLVVLIIVVGVGYSGYVVSQNQDQNAQAQAVDRSAALQAPNQLRSTCLMHIVDNSTLTYDSRYGYSGYERIIYTMGISNPTRYAIDAALNFSLTVPGTDRPLLTTNAQVHLLPNSATRVGFTFKISASQLNSNTVPPTGDFSGSIISASGNYSVVGTYNTYTTAAGLVPQGTPNSNGVTLLPGC